MRLWHIALVAVALSGCATLPPSRPSIEGVHTASNYFNTRVTLELKDDGSYTRRIDFAYCSPIVMDLGDGKQASLSGWTNYESGFWKIEDRIVLLDAQDRNMENPNAERADFDLVRKIPMTYQFPHGWVLIYPGEIWTVMKKSPNQRPERNAGAMSVSSSTPGPGVAHP